MTDTPETPTRPRKVTAPRAPQPVDAPAEDATANTDRTYHDSVTGRPVDSSGTFLDGIRGAEAQVEAHRIVADDWPALQDEQDAKDEQSEEQHNGHE